MPARCGIRSRQLARSGATSGAVTILKSMASSALVRMNNSSPRSASEYLHALLARRDQARRRLGRAEIDQSLFRGLVIAAGDHAEAAGGRSRGYG